MRAATGYVVGGLLIFAFYAWQAGIDEECRRAGGVPIQGHGCGGGTRHVCIKKDAVLP